MKKVWAIFLLILLAMAIGCRDEQRPPHVALSSMGTNVVIYSELPDQAVIVSVDGSQLTKAQIEQAIALDIALFRNKGDLISGKIDQALKNKLAKRIRDQHIAKSLLLGASRRGGIVPNASYLQRARTEIAQTYGRKGETNSYEQILRGLKPDLRKLLEENVASAAMIYAYLASVAGDNANVSDAEVSDVVKQAGDLKKRSETLLAEQRAKAQKLYGRLFAGEKFATVAAESDVAAEDEGVGVWGEFSIGELERMYPDLVSVVSSLKEGEFSKPIERDDAIYIVRLKSRPLNGPRVGSDVDIEADQSRMTLERIVLRLPIMYEAGTVDEIRSGIGKRKMAEYQRDILLPELRRNADVSFPSGNVRFTTTTKKRK